jgi:hypothetical protein
MKTKAVPKLAAVWTVSSRDVSARADLAEGTASNTAIEAW